MEKRPLISLSEALSIIKPFASCCGGEERVSFDKALDRVIAEDVRSPIDVPPFDRAAMDGYAVRGEDTFGASTEHPVKLRRASTNIVHEHEYLSIQTGMKMPEGANAVVMIEHAKESNVGILNVFVPTPPGKNVSFKGEDVKKGEVVIKSGKRLNAYDIGLLASICKTEVKVRKKPVVGIIATGDEIFDPSRTKGKASEVEKERNEKHKERSESCEKRVSCEEHEECAECEEQEEHEKQEERARDALVGEVIEKEGRIPDSNSYVLSALLSDIAHPVRFGIVADDVEQLKHAISDALRRCDVLLVTGGSSVGERDYVEDAVLRIGGEVLFHGVSIRPGEPVGFAVVRKKPVFMLPGYPVAAISAYELLVKPFLFNALTFNALTADLTRKIVAISERRIPSSIGRTDFVRVKLRYDENEGKILASPVRLSGSGILSSMTKSDGYIIIDENREYIERGERVIVHLHK